MVKTQERLNMKLTKRQGNWRTRILIHQRGFSNPGNDNEEKGVTISKKKKTKRCFSERRENVCTRYRRGQ